MGCARGGVRCRGPARPIPPSCGPRRCATGCATMTPTRAGDSRATRPPTRGRPHAPLAVQPRGEGRVCRDALVPGARRRAPGPTRIVPRGSPAAPARGRGADGALRAAAPAPNPIARDFAPPPPTGVGRGPARLSPVGGGGRHRAVLLDTRARRPGAGPTPTPVAATSTPPPTGRRSRRRGTRARRTGRAIPRAAMAERPVATPKAELVDAYRRPTRAGARRHPLAVAGSCSALADARGGATRDLRRARGPVPPPSPPLGAHLPQPRRP